MSWGPTLLIGFLTGLVGLFVAGLLAIACVDWYRVSNFEGASGFFVIGAALLGGMVSCLIGIIVARLLGGEVTPGFWKALAAAVGIVVGIGGAAMLIAYALADRTENTVVRDSHDESAQKEAGEEACFDAIPPDAALRDWLPYTVTWQSETRRSVAVARIMARPDYVSELKELMLDPNKEIAGNAIRFVGELSIPNHALLAAVREVARDLIQRIRAVNDLPIEHDQSFEAAAEVAYRFSIWIGTVKALRENGSGDFLPELRQILDLSRVRTDIVTMQSDVRRVASHYLHLWAGVALLPGDTP